MGNNLLWVAHHDNATQRIFVYDPSGTFSPEIILPPGQDAPDESQLAALSNLTLGQIYLLVVEQEQTVDLKGKIFTLTQGVNFILWR